MKQELEYERRFQRHYDELKWLYCELYEGGMPFFEDLCEKMRKKYQYRRRDLKELDRERESHPDWYKGNDILGMMMYTDAFAGNLQGVESKLDYLEE